MPTTLPVDKPAGPTRAPRVLLLLRSTLLVTVFSQQRNSQRSSTCVFVQEAVSLPHLSKGLRRRRRALNRSALEVGGG